LAATGNLKKITEELSFDCNSPCKFARMKWLLWIAKVILIDQPFRLDSNFERNLLTCRCDDLQSFGAVDSETIAEALLERMYANFAYNKIGKAEECFKNALASIDLQIEVTGVLGKRTRFQQNLIAQLVARCMPPNVSLRDDSLLENVALESDTSSSNNSSKLSPISLACMLAAGVIERKIQSSDELLNEKCASYLDEVIAQRRNWAVQASALLQRSELEWTRMRRAERACMQMEALSKLVNGAEIKKQIEEEKPGNYLKDHP
uniref:Uncharacterized protein n=1 Tax=Gongylonema pulchrum TaxID=637853 RepID=A0A183E7W3_9BILA